MYHASIHSSQVLLHVTIVEASTCMLGAELMGRSARERPVESADFHMKATSDTRKSKLWTINVRPSSGPLQHYNS